MNDMRNLEILSYDNYRSWVFRAKNHLIEHGLWKYCENLPPAATDPDFQTFKEGSDKAIAKIVKLIDNSQITYVKNAQNAKLAWDNLYEQHSTVSRMTISNALRDLFTIRIAHGSSMAVHVTRLCTLFDRLADYGEDVKEHLKLAALSASIYHDEDYSAISSTLDAWPDNTLTFNEASKILINEWHKLKDPPLSEPVVTGETEETDVAMKVNPKKRRRFRKKKFYNNNNRQSDWYSRRGNDGLRSDDDYDDGNGSKKPINQQSAKITRFIAYSYIAKSFYSSCEVSSPSLKSTAFFIDSGCTRHMCHDKNHFSEFSRSDGIVCVANGEKLKVCGKGKVTLTVRCDDKSLCELQLNNVLFVPGLDCNLVSVKQLTGDETKILFDNDKCFLLRGKDRLGIGKFSNDLYRLNVIDKCLKISNHKHVDCIHDWHRKMAHRNLKDVKATLRELNIYFPSCNCSDLCEACIRGKMAQKPYPKCAKPVDNVHDVVVSDVCELSTNSFDNMRYFMTMIDVRSSFTHVYFLKKKSDVYDSIIHHIEMLKNVFNRKMKVMRFDLGKEYTNLKLLNYLKKEGILYQTTVGYASQQNGISERKNRELVEAGRTMLVESQLPKQLWTEAIATANYVQNRLYDIKKKEIPYQIFHRKPVVDFHPHCFGSFAYHQIPKIKRRKLDDNAVKLRFVGFDTHAKGFRLYDSSKRQIILSRNVIFLDEKVDIEKYLPSSSLLSNVNKSKPIRMVLPDSPVKVVEPSELPEIIEIDNTSQSDGETHRNSRDASSGTPPSRESDDEYRASHESEEEESDFDYETGNESLNNTVTGSNDHHQQEEHEEQNRTAEEENFQQNFPETPRRTGRIREAPKRYGFDDFALVTAACDYEPNTFKQAMSCVQKSQWKHAMDEEINALERNGTWEVVDLPRNKTVVGSRWVFKVKKNFNGEISQYKARCVAQGFNQKFGIHYNEVFAPTARSSTFRMLLSFAGIQNLKVKQFDIKNAFLNGKLQEEIFMRPPKGYEVEGKVLKLKRSIYGLKQSANVWNKAFDKVLTDNGFIASNADKCLYSRYQNNDVCHVLVHVDDLLIVAKNTEIIDEVSKNINKHFEVKDIGEAKNYLGIDITRDRKGDVFISQEQYIDDIVRCAKLEDSKTSSHPLDVGYFKLEHKNPLQSNEEYRKLIGKLLYVSTNTRPDIAASVCILSQKVSNPSEVDLNELKRLIKYIKSTKNLKLRLSNKRRPSQLSIFSDANFAEDSKDRKSNTGYISSVNGGTISWCCRKQDIVTLSAMEAEYVALSETCKEIIWLRELIKSFKSYTAYKYQVNTDSQSCISHIKNQKFSNRTKHIDTKFHFIKDLYNEKRIDLQYVSTNDNTADLLTKPLGPQRIKTLRKLAGLN